MFTVFGAMCMQVAFVGCVETSPRANRDDEYCNFMYYETEIVDEQCREICEKHPEGLGNYYHRYENE